MIEFYRRITEFLKEYLEIPDEFIRTDGIVKPEAAACCFRYLISEEVFSDWDEIQKELYQEYGIFAAETVMEGIR